VVSVGACFFTSRSLYLIFVWFKIIKLSWELQECFTPITGNALYELLANIIIQGCYLIFCGNSLKRSIATILTQLTSFYTVILILTISRSTTHFPYMRRSILSNVINVLIRGTVDMPFCRDVIAWCQDILFPLRS